MVSTGLKVGCCMGCVVFIAALALFSASFAIVRPLEMGIAMNRNIMTIQHDKLWDSGRRMPGIGRTFLLFPITQQVIQIGNSYSMDTRFSGSIKCRSSDGMPIFVDVSFAYVLSRDPEDLTRLYRDVVDENGWNQLYGRTAQAAIRDVTAKYDAFQFITNRTVIADNMDTALSSALSKMFASVSMFELTNMEFENDFAYAIEVTEVAKQDIEQANAERDVAVIDAQSELVVATKQAQVQIAEATAQAAALINQAEAEAVTLMAHTRAQINGYKALKEKLNFTSSAELLDYLFVTAVQDNAAQQVLLNMPYPTTLKLQQ